MREVDFLPYSPGDFKSTGENVNDEKAGSIVSPDDFGSPGEYFDHLMRVKKGLHP